MNVAYTSLSPSSMFADRPALRYTPLPPSRQTYTHETSRSLHKGAGTPFFPRKQMAQVHQWEDVAHIVYRSKRKLVHKMWFDADGVWSHSLHHALSLLSL